jgi:hypothetical protein
MEDQFVSGIDRIENAGGQCVRLVTYVMRDIDGNMTPCEGPHVVMPLDALPDAVGKALSAMGRQIIVRPNGQVLLAN